MVSSARPGHILMWLLSHMAALVGDLSGFLVLLHPVGLLPSPPPSLFFPLLVSVTDVWMPAMEPMAGLQGLAVVGVLLGPGTGWPASSRSPWTSQAPNLHFVM